MSFFIFVFNPTLVSARIIANSRLLVDWLTTSATTGSILADSWARDVGTQQKRSHTADIQFIDLSFIESFLSRSKAARRFSNSPSWKFISVCSVLNNSEIMRYKGCAFLVVLAQYADKVLWQSLQKTDRPESTGFFPSRHCANEFPYMETRK